MARVNVEPHALRDPRYKSLAKAIGVTKWDALARMIAVWDLCQERNSYVLDAEMLNALHDDVEDFAGAVVSSKLGRPQRHGIYICGTKGRIEWLEKKRVNGRKGGRPNKNQIDDGPETETKPIGLRDDNPLAPALTPTEKKKEKEKSARELVEEFALDESLRTWASKNTPSVPPDQETEAWRDRCRANGYRTNAGPIRNAAASWMTAMRYAEKRGNYRGPSRSNRTSSSQSQTTPRESLAAKYGHRSIEDVLKERELSKVSGAATGGSNDPVC